MSLISRKNKIGRIYKDSRNLLNQQVRKKEAENLFLADEAGTATAESPAEVPATGKPKKVRKPIDTTILDVGIILDEELVINFSMYMLVYIRLSVYIYIYILVCIKSGYHVRCNFQHFCKTC